MTELDMQQRRALAREMRERIADKWTLLAIDELWDGSLRFTELREKLGRVSQKMLTKTLRQMERDGLVTRTVYPVVPAHVEYKLTELGEGLSKATCALWLWIQEHGSALERSRQTYDETHGIGC